MSLALRSHQLLFCQHILLFVLFVVKDEKKKKGEKDDKEKPRE